MIKPIWASVAASFAVALLFLSVLLPKQEAYAYVQVQVNPGIELGIDENYKVISVRELNDDGYDLISAMSEWQDQPLDIVLENVVQLSLKDATEEITITTVADKDDAIADDAIVNAVLAISSKVLAGDIAVQLKDASRAEWRRSIENNVPAGQLVKDSKKFTNEEKEEPVQRDKKDKAPSKEGDSGDNPPKEMKPDSNLKEKSEEPASSDKKATPPGQEQRKQNPAAEKGKNQPPGQEKRNEVPGQKKKEERKDKEQPQKDKGKETPPGKPKKNEGKNEGKGNVNGSGPPPKNDNAHDNPKPSNSDSSEKDKEEDSNRGNQISEEKAEPEKEESSNEHTENHKKPVRENNNGSANREDHGNEHNDGNENNGNSRNNGNGEGNNN